MKELIEQLKNKGYDVELKEEKREKNIIFKKGMEQRRVIIEEKSTIYKFSTHFGILDIAKAEDVWLIIETIEKESQKKNKWLILDERISTDIQTVVMQKGFYALERDEDEEIDLELLTDIVDELNEREIYFMSYETKEQIKKCLTLRKEAGRVIQEYMKEELLFYAEESFNRFQVHTHGTNSHLYFAIKNGKLCITIFEKEKEKTAPFICFDTKEECKQQLHLWSEKRRKEQRIRNLTKPSQFFMEELIDSKHVSNAINFEIRKKLFDQIPTDFPNNELEKLAAFHVKHQPLQFINLNTDHVFFYFGNKGYVLNQKRNDVYVVEKSPNTAEDVRSILQANFEREINKTLKGL